MRDVVLTYAAYAAIPLIAAEVAPWLMLPLALTGVGEGVAGLAVLGAAAGLAGAGSAWLNVENGEKWYQGLGLQLIATVGELWARSSWDDTAYRAYQEAQRDAQDAKAFAARAEADRAPLSSDWRKYGNVGFLEGDIDGIGSISLRAHSKVTWAGQRYSDAGWVLAREDRVFQTRVIGGYDRFRDTEAKLLEDVAYRLGGNRGASGTLTLFTELRPCPSCTDVMCQFRGRFPNIRLRVLDGRGFSW